VTEKMIIPAAILQRRDLCPEETLEDTLWWMHSVYMPMFDRAADELGGLTVNQFAELTDLWSGDHLPRTQGWGSDLVALRKKVAVELLRTRLSAEKLAEVLGVTPRTFAEHATAKRVAWQWLVWDEAVCAGVDRRTATHMCGMSMDTTRRWARQRPWTNAAQELAAEIDQPPAVAAVSFLFDQGLMPVEAHRWWCENRADDPYGLSAVQHAFQVWRDANPERAAQIRAANCAECGDPFERRNAHALYCSKRCGWRASNRRQLAKRRTLVVCDGCGKTFTKTKDSQRFCSVACGNRARKRLERQRSVTGNEQGFCGGAPTQNNMGSQDHGEDAA